MTTKKLIANNDYLLPQSLEGLHLQSREWLETVAFWKDETRFFSKLLKIREASVDSGDYPGLLEELDSLHQSLIDYLTGEIQEHERFLSDLVKGAAGISDSDYREEHRKLAAKMMAFGTQFRKFKNTVFTYARTW